MPRSAIFWHHFAILYIYLAAFFQSGRLAYAAAVALAAVLDGCTDDTLLAIAVALPSRADLLRFVLASHAAAQRLYFTTTSYGSAVPSGAASAASGGGAAAQAADTWSIAEEAARQWIVNCTDQERGKQVRMRQRSSSHFSPCMNAAILRILPHRAGWRLAGLVSCFVSHSSWRD